MRWLLLVLILVVGLFQYWLWLGEGGLLKQPALERQILQQRQENLALQQRNAALEAKVRYLKDGLEGIEERARHDLGMIKKGETFYMLSEKDSP